MALLQRCGLPLSTAVWRTKQCLLQARLIRPASLAATIRRHQSFHTTPPVCILEEFFDDPANWGAKTVKVGRGWRTEELRIKSNEDLHKLWYVLLKELNMLVTMEYAHKQENILFPNPERIDKMRESMSNLESVVKERNRAFWLLEVGETGEPPVEKVVDEFGLHEPRQLTECAVPEELNPWNQVIKYEPNLETENLLLLYRESKERKTFRKNREDKAFITKLFQQFPDLDIEALEERYPNIDPEEIIKIRDSSQARGHHDKNRD